MKVNLKKLKNMRSSVAIFLNNQAKNNFPATVPEPEPKPIKKQIEGQKSIAFI
jgi:hypothetical protein